MGAMALSILLTVSTSAFLMAALSINLDETSTRQELSNSAESPFLPIGFIHNDGQYEEEVLFHARTRSGTIFLTADAIVYALPRCEDGSLVGGVAIKEVFCEMPNSNIAGKERQGVRLNYFKGNDPSKWGVNIPAWSTVDYGEVFPGIKLSLSLNDGKCEKTFTVEPGTDPAGIRIPLEGVEKLSQSDEGGLSCVSESEKVVFTKPVAFQWIDGRRIDVPATYKIDGLSYGFKVGEYDPRCPLVIDPMIASTYLGGSARDSCYAMAVAGNGDIYVAGYTGSADFPTVLGCYDMTHNGGDEDLFVSLLDGSLSSLIASTFIGGSYDEYLEIHSGLALAADGSVCIAAGTYSYDFPTSIDAYDRSYNSEGDAVIFRLNGDLDTLEASTFLGSFRSDFASPLTIAEDGAVYVAGITQDSTSNFPTTEGAYDRVPNGSWDTFVSCFDPDLTTLVASTLLGGNFPDRPKCLVCDNDGGIYVAGGTSSIDFPTTAGAFDETFNHASGIPDHDIFISHFDLELTTLNLSTFVGGLYEDMCMDLIMDVDDTLIIAGYSGSHDFPTTSGAYQEQKLYQTDFIVSRINRQLSDLIASTYLGGNGQDFGYCAALDDAGYIAVAGRTSSEDIPIPPGSHGDINFKDSDPYVARLDGNLRRLTSASILGGNSALGITNEECFDVEFIGGDKIAVCGRTHSYEHQTTVGAYAEESSGSYDGFITIYDELMTRDPGKLVVGPGAASENPPLIRIYPAAQDSVYGFEFGPYGSPHFGVNVACGNLDEDEADEILSGAGPGEIYGPHVRAFEIDGAPLPGLSFLAYGTNRWGVNVATGDIDADGYAEVITGAGPGEVFGPHVRAFDYDGGPGVTPVPGVSYFAYGTPKWGVNVTAGDIDGDGYDEIITGAGPGAIYGPHVRGWDVDGGQAAAIPGISFFAYGTLKYGVNVSAGDMDGDGIDEIITGAGPGIEFGPHVRGWNYDGSVITALQGFSFFAWQTGPLHYGAKVCAAADMDDDGRNELVVGHGPAPGADSEVKVFTYDGSSVNDWFSLVAFPEFSYGVNVTAGSF